MIYTHCTPLRGIYLTVSEYTQLIYRSISIPIRVRSIWRYDEGLTGVVKIEPTSLAALSVCLKGVGGS